MTSSGFPINPLMPPIRPYPNATIVIKTIDSPRYFPTIKDIVPMGYVDSSCQLPSSFSDVNEKEPRNSVINGKRYRIRFNIEPVVPEYP
ncbi:choline kinase [Paenibacillus amylolyticus]|uniref:Choline kinase n=1 Tax=Paenibacillus amylolyticus TaxID=1451 RepID=A0A117I164_PAEAM|nr:choline kinase [Paenibacillus amylolyticus]